MVEEWVPLLMGTVKCIIDYDCILLIVILSRIAYVGHIRLEHNILWVISRRQVWMFEGYYQWHPRLNQLT